MNLEQVKRMFRDAGAKSLFVKVLAENDNSKNQVYFGGNFEALNLFPVEEIVADSKGGHAIFKARLHFSWVTKDGIVDHAPGAQLILYPQYPEVRFSGFLKGCYYAPSILMSSRIAGRVLFLGVTGDRKMLGHVVDVASRTAEEFRRLGLVPGKGVFVELDLPQVEGEADSRTRLLAELHRIHQLGWIDSKQLDSYGNLNPCRAPQCGGFTLEAELGIAKNSISGPDFLGWEVKQHAVTGFSNPNSGSAITLMTPEPTGGYYKDHGVEQFVRRFGYMDKNDKPDRLNFGGVHRVGDFQGTTGLTLVLAGYDVAAGKITNANGSILLTDCNDVIAAEWAFTGLLAHWSKKHSKAVYVPAMRRIDPAWQYCYGPRVRLGQRTDPLKLLAAFAGKLVYYDPGIKLENASTTPKVKRRSQFRIASRNVGSLYETMETVDV